jgi:hypothetical protein
MTLPEKVNASWIATLGDDKLLKAETQLHAEFLKEETAEKKRRGAGYTMLRGPQSLVDAWLRWLLVNNETLSRGLVVQRRRNSHVS